MADDVVVTTGTGDDVSTIPDGTRFSAEEFTTLNGESVTAQKAFRSILSYRAEDGVVEDITDPATGAKQETANEHLQAIRDSLESTGVTTFGAKGSKTFSVEAPDDTASEIAPDWQSRICITIVNTGDVSVYLGNDNSVTTSNGVELAAGETLTDDASADPWWAICATGETGELRIVDVGT